MAQAQATPTPAKTRAPKGKTIGGLDGASSVRRELARVYRELRLGLLDRDDAKALGYLLSLLIRVLDAEAFEARIAELERRAGLRA